MVIKLEAVKLEMNHIPTVGQKLQITNLDYIIVSEEWVVLTVEYPTVTFSCKKWWDYNAITMQGQTAEVVIGQVIETNDRECIVAFSQYSQLPLEKGLLIQGNKASYLRQLNPPELI